MSKILVANRGEVAVRIVRAAAALGLKTVAVFAKDDAESLHVRKADEARALPGEGAAAYLDGAALVAAARDAGATAVHPGYGFVSESASFARLCQEAGLVFIGPSPEVLALFGDKTSARGLAKKLDVPLLPGTAAATTLAEARAFFGEHGPVMIKALAGGGGRGMRAVFDANALEEAFARCSSEAQQAFGNGELYVERLLRRAKHVEVQIVGDGSGAVTALGDRDCSVQRRNQKLIEIAPSSLSAGLRERLVQASLRMAAHVKYASLGTFEYLVSGDDFFFIEANPRLQVEHTVTEEITGVDLVRAQIRVALGASLADVGLAVSPPLRGVAIQARVNLETFDKSGEARPAAGTLTAFTPPSGPGIRVDTYGYTGYRTSLRYDSLLAKVIVRGDDLAHAALATDAALGETQIAGVATNISLLRKVLRHPDFVNATTSFLADHPALFDDATPPTLFDGLAAAAAAPARRAVTAPPGTIALLAPFQAMIIAAPVAPGEHVRKGTVLVVLEAMKMEHAVRADQDLVVRELLVTKGELVAEGAPLAYLEARELTGAAGDAARAPEPEDDWAPEIAEIERRHQVALGMGGPDKVARQHTTGRLSVRERIDALVDPGSFREIGPLTGFAEYTEDGELASLVPANFVAGTAKIEGRRIILGADDFSLRGGSGDGAIWAKQIFSEQLAREQHVPVVRLLDGASGGGSVKMATQAGYTYVPVNPGWDAVVENLSLVPVVAACLGPTVGLGAARLVMSHLAIMVEGIGQLFTAGPPVVKGGTGEDLTKEQLGGASVHRHNGAIERIVATEAEAFTETRRFLSYLPSSCFQIPPVITSADRPDRSDPGLLSAVPKNQRAPYLIGPILEAIFDQDSIFPYAGYGDSIITALARLNGHPVAVIATEPLKGATMSAGGAQAITRLVDLCETFHVPLVSLTDQAGMTIGLAAEKAATIRFGARAIVAVYQTRVPQAELILRRVYGVGGAGIVNRHRAVRSWAWPSGDWGSLPMQGGVEAAFRAQLDTITDPKEHAAMIDRIQKQLVSIGSPFRTAEKFGVQDIIDPRDSRAILCEWVEDAYAVLPEQVGRPSFGTRP